MDTKNKQQCEIFIEPSWCSRLNDDYFLNQFPQGLYIKDLSFKYVVCNITYSAEIGIPPKVLIGSNDSTLFSAASSEEYVHNDQLVLQSETQNCFSELVEIKGEKQWIKVVKSPFRDRQGKIIGILGVVQNTAGENITPAKHPDQAYEALSHAHGDLVCRWLPDTTITYVNDGYCNYFGKVRKELLGTPWITLLPNDQRHGVEKHNAKICKERKTTRICHEVLDAKGKRCWQEWVDSPIFDATGTVIEIQSSGRDCTDLKRTEETLKYQADLFNGLLQATSEGYWLVNDQGEVIDVNVPLCTMLGYSRAELLKMNIGELDANESKQDIEEHINTLFKKEYELFETQHQTKSGKIIDIEIRAIHLNINGKDMIASFFRDITERKRFEKEKKEYAVNASIFKYQNNFFAGVNHQVMTPLNAILGFSKKLLNKNTLSTNPQNDISQIIHHSAIHLSRTLKNMIHMAKINSEGLHIDEELFDLMELLEDLDKSFRYRIEENGLYFVITLDQHVPWSVKGDKEKFKTILESLLDNSLNRTITGGVKLSLSAESFASSPTSSSTPLVNLIVEVRDTGTKGEFDLLQNSDALDPLSLTYTDKDNFRLNLLICQQYILLMGGTLSSKVTPGGGNCFRFTIKMKRGLGDKLNEQERNIRITKLSAINASHPLESIKTFTAVNLLCMPKELLGQLKGFVINGDMESFMQTLDLIRGQQPEIERKLRTLAYDYDYRTLLSLLNTDSIEISNE